MNSRLLGSLHHIGVCLDERDFFSRFSSQEIQWDELQGVYTFWKPLDVDGIYVEYFTKSGRAKNYPIGYNHVCFNVPSAGFVSNFTDGLRKCNLGFGLTSLEKSGSSQCGEVIFIYMKSLGILEFNLEE